MAYEMFKPYYIKVSFICSSLNVILMELRRSKQRLAATQTSKSAHAILQPKL